jgi:putative hemolysin
MAANRLTGSRVSSSFDLTVEGIERMPREGRLIVAANHPTGLADGVAVWDLLKRVREDIIFFANADAIRVNPKFEDVIIPVEWVMEKRSPAKARETLKRAGEAFARREVRRHLPSPGVSRGRKVTD